MRSAPRRSALAATGALNRGEAVPRDAGRGPEAWKSGRGHRRLMGAGHDDGFIPDLGLLRHLVP
ncbi:MAG: hypothetical protein ACRDRJ_35475 [Streptosporangiaceae bacterium]